MASGHIWGPSGPRGGPSGHQSGSGRLREWEYIIVTEKEEEKDEESLVLLTNIYKSL